MNPAGNINNSWMNSDQPVPYPKKVKKFLKMTGIIPPAGHKATDPITIREFVQIIKQSGIKLTPDWQESLDKFEAALKILFQEMGIIKGKELRADALVGGYKEDIQQVTGLLGSLVNVVGAYDIPEEHAYNEMTRRLEKEKRIPIEEQLLNISDKSVQDMLQELENEQWDAATLPFDDPNFPLIALKALQTGRITAQQFATCCIFRAAHQQVNSAPKEIYLFPAKAAPPLLVTVPLFDATGKPSKDAVAIVKNSVKSGMCYNLSDYQEYAFLDQSKIDLFFDLMRKLPASEQQFQMMPDTSCEITRAIMIGRSIPVFHAIRANDLEDVPTMKQFTSFPEDLSVVQIVPSAGMMQTLLTAMCGENAVKMNYVLGVPTLDDIRKNGLESSRDVSIPFDPWAPLPKKAATLETTELGHLFYDFYRSFVASWVPQGHRELFIDALDTLKSNGLDETTAKAFEKLCYYFHDMEHLVYLPHKFTLNTKYNQLLLPQKSPMLFWATLANTIERSKLTSEQRKQVVELFVQRYAVDEVGKNRGVAAKDLLELADVITKELAKQEKPSEFLAGSTVFQMKELYLKAH